MEKKYDKTVMPLRSSQPKGNPRFYTHVSAHTHTHTFKSYGGELYKVLCWGGAVGEPRKASQRKHNLS